MTRKLHRWEDIRERTLSPERRAAIDASVASELLEMVLQELREASGKTTVEVADLLEATRSQLSLIERSLDPRLAILRRYVEELGGQLEVSASFGDRRVALHCV